MLPGSNPGASKCPFLMPARLPNNNNKPVLFSSSFVHFVPFPQLLPFVHFAAALCASRTSSTSCTWRKICSLGTQPRGQQFDADGRGSDVVIVARSEDGLVPGRLLDAVLLLRGVPVGATVWPEHISRSEPAPLLRTALSPKATALAALVV